MAESALVEEPQLSDDGQRLDVADATSCFKRRRTGFAAALLSKLSSQTSNVGLPQVFSYSRGTSTLNRLLIGVGNTPSREGDRALEVEQAQPSAASSLEDEAWTCCQKQRQPSEYYCNDCGRSRAQQAHPTTQQMPDSQQAHGQSIVGMSRVRVYTCKQCGGIGHNARSCEKKNGPQHLQIKSIGCDAKSTDDSMVHCDGPSSSSRERTIFWQCSTLGCEYPMHRVVYNDDPERFSKREFHLKSHTFVGQAQVGYRADKDSVDIALALNPPSPTKLHKRSREGDATALHAIADECITPDSRKTCRRCGQKGHNSRTCTQPTPYTKMESRKEEVVFWQCASPDCGSKMHSVVYNDDPKREQKKAFHLKLHKSAAQHLDSGSRYSEAVPRSTEIDRVNHNEEMVFAPKAHAEIPDSTISQQGLHSPPENGTAESDDSEIETIASVARKFADAPRECAEAHQQDAMESCMQAESSEKLEKACPARMGQHRAHICGQVISAEPAENCPRCMGQNRVHTCGKGTGEKLSPACMGQHEHGTDVGGQERGSVTTTGHVDMEIPPKTMADSSDSLSNRPEESNHDPRERGTQEQLIVDEALPTVRVATMLELESIANELIDLFSKQTFKEHREFVGVSGCTSSRRLCSLLRGVYTRMPSRIAGKPAFQKIRMRPLHAAHFFELLPVFIMWHSKLACWVICDKPKHVSYQYARTLSDPYGSDLTAFAGEWSVRNQKDADVSFEQDPGLEVFDLSGASQA